MDGQLDIATLQAELAARDAELAARDARIAGLEQQVAKLTEALARNSNNSNLPPSSDGPGKNAAKRQRRKKRGKGRTRGGQRGHRGSHRMLLPPEKVDEIVDLYPAECENCWGSLPGVEDPPL